MIILGLYLTFSLFFFYNSSFNKFAIFNKLKKQYELLIFFFFYKLYVTLNCFSSAKYKFIFQKQYIYK